MRVTSEQVKAGQAVYSRRTLAIYDFVVLGVSNRFIWRCPTHHLARHYQQHVTDNHLDVGVGSGFFLDRCRFSSTSPRLALMDLNNDALSYAGQRVSRYRPESYQRNVLEPIPFDGGRFDSIAINYLLHCLPGDLATKSIVFDHLSALMNPGATLFGATLLQGGVPRSRLARTLMGTYNKKGIFSNQQDDLESLRRELNRRFRKVSIDVVGCAALFSASNQRDSID